MTSGKQNLSTIFQFFVSVFISIVPKATNKYDGAVKMSLRALSLSYSAERIAAQQIEKIRRQTA